MLEEDRWLAVAVQAQKYSHVKSKEDPLSKEKQGTSLLLAGTKKGSLLVLDYKSGGANFSVKVTLCQQQQHACMCSCFL